MEPVSGSAIPTESLEKPTPGLPAFEAVECFCGSVFIRLANRAAAVVGLTP